MSDNDSKFGYPPGKGPEDYRHLTGEQNYANKVYGDNRGVEMPRRRYSDNDLHNFIRETAVFFGRTLSRSEATVLLDCAAKILLPREPGQEG